MHRIICEKIGKGQHYRTIIINTGGYILYTDIRCIGSTLNAWNVFVYLNASQCRLFLGRVCGCGHVTAGAGPVGVVVGPGRGQQLVRVRTKVVALGLKKKFYIIICY